MRPTFAALKQKVPLVPLAFDSIGQYLLGINTTVPANEWTIKETKVADGEPQTSLTASYKLKSFPKTWQFLNHVAEAAHENRHHPTIITTYNKVDVELTTHDAGNRVTMKDLRLAQQINNAFLIANRDKSRVQLKGFFETTKDLVHEGQVSKVIKDLTKH